MMRMFSMLRHNLSPNFLKHPCLSRFSFLKFYSCVISNIKGEHVANKRGC
jgi:hypothetical protein